MNITAVIVWYNPSYEEINNILSYSNQFKRVYIVDNSSADNSKLSQNIENAIYIPLLENKGIGYALNYGCEHAKKDGFEWVMTMDQDSYWDSHNLQQYISFVEKHHSKLNVSFAPNPIYAQENTYFEEIIGSYKKETKEKIEHDKNNIIELDRVICSGNILSLDIWEKVGKFYTPFFIDEVDHEFCFKLRENGYCIQQIISIKMNHALGNPRKTFFKIPSYHLSKRLYYICRNRLYMRLLHPFYAKKYNYNIWARIRGVILNLYFDQIKYIWRAVYDAKHHRLGKYEDLWK